MMLRECRLETNEFYPSNHRGKILSTAIVFIVEFFFQATDTENSKEFIMSYYIWQEKAIILNTMGCSFWICVTFEDVRNYEDEIVN